MTVKQISDIIIHNQRVCVWNVSTRKRLFDGINENMPEELNDIKVRFVSSELNPDIETRTYSVVTTIFVD